MNLGLLFHKNTDPGNYCTTNNMYYEMYLWCITRSGASCFVLNTAGLCSASYQGISKVHVAISE